MKSNQNKYTIIFILMAIQWAIGQKTNNDTIWWKDKPNSYTLLSELNTVTIKLNNGSQRKDVMIRQVDSYSGKIEYKGEGVLHDVLISEIKMIIPGKHYYHVVEFDKNNKPLIKITNQIDPFKEYVKFPEHTLPKKYLQTSLSKAPDSTSYTNMKSKNDPDVKPVDTLILNNGRVILIHVQGIEDRNLRYKRADVPNGPIYNVGIGTAIIKQYKLNYTIDYSNNK